LPLFVNGRKRATAGTKRPLELANASFQLRHPLWQRILVCRNSDSRRDNDGDIGTAVHIALPPARDEHADEKADEATDGRAGAVESEAANQRPDDETNQRSHLVLLAHPGATTSDFLAA
jgi:hypothetical protein